MILKLSGGYQSTLGILIHFIGQAEKWGYLLCYKNDTIDP